MPEQELDLLQFATTLVAQPGAGPAKVRRRDVAEIAGLARLFYDASYDFRTKPCVAIRPALLIARKIGPSLIFASTIQVRNAVAIQNGTGTVRTWPPLPTRSAKTQCSSRCCRSGTQSAATSARRIRNPIEQLPWRNLVFPGGCGGRIRQAPASLVRRLADCQAARQTFWHL